jgi:SAM-dependent methyltransferase
VIHPRAGEAYRPPDYWRALHEAAEGLGIVGYPTLPLVFNRHVYSNAARGVLRGLAASGVTVRDRDVLDVGSGTGFWVDLWRREGAAHVAGSDLVPAAVDRMRERFPGSEITAADITEQPPFPGQAFDVVSIMSVLHHIVNEEHFDRALANLASQLSDDGVLAVLDPIVLRGRWMAPAAESAHNVVRARSRWETGAADAGLRIAAVVPTSAFLSDPVDAGSRAAFAAHRMFWRGLTGGLQGRDRFASIVVPPLAALDRAVAARLRYGPSAKLIVLRRAG